MLLTRIASALRRAGHEVAPLVAVSCMLACSKGAPSDKGDKGDKSDDERTISRFVTLQSQRALEDFVQRAHPPRGYEHLALTGSIVDLGPLARLRVPILDLTIGPLDRLTSTRGIEALDVRGGLTVVDAPALVELWGPRLSLDGFGDPACVTIARAPSLSIVHLATLPHARDCLTMRDDATAHHVCVLDVGDACPAAVSNDDERARIGTECAGERAILSGCGYGVGANENNESASSTSSTR